MAEARSGFAITPNDGADLPQPIHKIFAAGAGTLRVDLADGTTVDIAIGANQIHHDLRIKKVHATGTSATGLVGFN